jgi:hypothetical protein
MSRRGCHGASLRLLPALILLSARVAFAQDPAPVIAPPEELEPRVIGSAGMTTVGFAGFVDRFNSSETLYPTNYTVQVDVSRFLSRRIAIRFGVVGSGSVGGDESSDGSAGAGAAALHAGGGGLFYFTPGSMVSAYAGVEYWSQVTRRAENDAGSVVGKFGVQAVVSSRASVFVEGGYGVNVRRGDKGETVTRLVGQLGLRIRF